MKERRTAIRGTRLKICYADDCVSIHTERFLKHFKDKYDLHAISFAQPKKIEGIPFHGFNTEKISGLERVFKPLWYPRGVLNAVLLNAIVRRIKPDILHGHYAFNYGVYCALSGYHPFLLTCWGSDILLSPKQQLHRLLVKFALKHADMVTVDSMAVLEGAIALGYPKERISYFPWGVDLEEFNPKIDGAQIRDERGWKDNPVVICVRGHKPVYSVDTLIRSIPLILRKEPRTRFIIGNKGALTPYLKELTEKLGLDKYVWFVGFIPHGRLAAYFNASDIYVSTSLSDSTSVTLLEAMACSLPMVLTDIPANREWIENNTNGFIVPKENSAEVAKKVIALIENESLRKEFGSKCLKMVEEKANWVKNMETLDSIYQRLV